jgi:DNA-binding protein H-NS
VNIETMSVVELKRLRADIEAAILKAEKRDRDEVLQELHKLAKSRGFDLEALVRPEHLARASKKVLAGRVAPKYRHPNQPELAWTGRGRRPAWVVEWEANGKAIDDLRVVAG